MIKSLTMINRIKWR